MFQHFVEHFVDTSRELKCIFHNFDANRYSSMQTNTNFIKSVRKIKWSKSKNISIGYSRQGEHKFSFWLKVKKEYIFPATPSQSWGPVKPPPLLENLVGDSTSPPPPQQKGGGWGAGAHYGLAKLLRSLQTGACNIKQIWAN